MEIVKHETILNRSHTTWYGGVAFRQDTEDMPASVKVILTQAAFEDLGSPDVITVTLQGGDRLNEEPVQLPPRLPNERASEYAMRVASQSPDWPRPPEDLT